MKNKDEKIQLLHPDPGKEAPRIDVWKYELVKKTILDLIPQNDDGVPFKTLSDRMAEQLPAEELRNLGSVG